MSLEKTHVVHIKEGFDFLGWNFRKYDGKLLIKPSKKNVKTFYSKVREVISTSKTVRQEDLIRLLNPILRGWALYHQPVVAKKTYSRMDHMIFRRYGAGQIDDTLRKHSSGSERNTLNP